MKYHHIVGIATILGLIYSPMARGDKVDDVKRIATREIYCHYKQDCKDAAMGVVSGHGTGPSQCNQSVFGNPGAYSSWKGSSYQWPDGTCWNFARNGVRFKSTRSLTTDLPNSGATVPDPWTGISCYSGDWCSGAKLATVWNWRDCDSGLYPIQDNVPDSTKIGAKSFQWGAICYHPQGRKAWTEPGNIPGRDISTLPPAAE